MFDLMLHRRLGQEVTNTSVLSDVSASCVERNANWLQ